MNIELIEVIETNCKQYLDFAQTLFGKKTDDWGFIGVEFNDMGPHLRYYPDRKQVAISLRDTSINNNLEFHIQLSHEVCHLLYPTANIETGFHEKPTVLNEGVSTYFSVFVTKDIAGDIDVCKLLKESNPKYYMAMAEVIKLMNIDSQAIKKVRQIQPYLNKLTKESFTKAGLEIPEELLKNLLATF